MHFAQVFGFPATHNTKNISLLGLCQPPTLPDFDDLVGEEHDSAADFTLGSPVVSDDELGELPLSQHRPPLFDLLSSSMMEVETAPEKNDGEVLVCHIFCFI